MADEYIVINKTSLLKRIEELENIEQVLIKSDMAHSITRGKIDELISLLNQSIPLIPEIEKAFEEGRMRTVLCYEEFDGFVKPIVDGNKQEYISNLKLDV